MSLTTREIDVPQRVARICQTQKSQPIQLLVTLRARAPVGHDCKVIWQHGLRGSQLREQKFDLYRATGLTDIPVLA